MGNTRDRAIISTLVDSSGRLSEVSNINEGDILWDRHVIKVTAKGDREVLMPFSTATEALLRDWFTEYRPNGGSDLGNQQKWHCLNAPKAGEGKQCEMQRSYLQKRIRFYSAP